MSVAQTDRVAARGEWSPVGFERHRSHYPRTPRLDASLAPTEEFIRLWQRGTALPASGRLRYAFVPGLFARALPGRFAAARSAFSRAGHRATLVAAGFADTAATAAERIRRVAEAASASDRWIWLAHSKGGLNLLRALAADECLRSRTAAVALVQCPAGTSRILDSILTQEYRETATRRTRIKESFQRALLSVLGATAGCREITTQGLPALLDAVRAARFEFPTLSVATWSVHPTTWLDSYHQRLSEIAPGMAHDGQFLLTDQLWPRFDQVLLPELDHAQPVLGGHGFDSGRFWLTIVELLHTRIAWQARTPNGRA